MTMIGNKMQMSTQGYDRRPYGVGLLVVGYDTQGPHLYQTCPSANYYDCKGMAIGARSQAARTYLEKNLDKLYDSTINELVAHALRALRDTLPAEMELTNKVISLNILFSLKPELELN
jgi:20S proteasome subunit alpha 6